MVFVKGHPTQMSPLNRMIKTRPISVNPHSHTRQVYSRRMLELQMNHMVNRPATRHTLNGYPYPHIHLLEVLPRPFG